MATTVKTAVSLPRKLFEQADRVAKRQKLSRSALFARALRHYLDDAAKHEVTTKLNRLYAAEPISDEDHEWLEWSAAQTGRRIARDRW